MPIIAGADLPIRPLVITGPAVDALERRKEDNNNAQVNAAAFVENFQRMRGALTKNLKSLAKTVRRS